MGLRGCRIIHKLLFLFMVIAPSTLAAPLCNQLLIGTGRGDVTGPVAEVGMMGYANLSQVAQGIHMRLWSRALVVEDPCRKKVVALVSSDLGMIFGGVKDAVVANLERKYPSVFEHGNLLLGATHSHAGPGGFAHHALYNITTFGFNPGVFNAVVEGITAAVVQAYTSRSAGSLEVAEGELIGYQFNRSLKSFEANPQDERSLFPLGADPRMIVLKARGIDEKLIASFNWFGVHGVSLPMTSRLVSGDNKGLAAYYVEKSQGVTYLKSDEFIAGFFQGSAGDVSPYPIDPAPVFASENEEIRVGFIRNEWSARGQAKIVTELMHQPGEVLSGKLGYAHQFVDLEHFRLSRGEETCKASLGISFAAGTENGKPVGLFDEHTVYGKNWWKFTVMPREQACQKEKVILLPTGSIKPDPWTARVLPLQLIQIGELAIIGVPFEITTVAGHRLIESVREQLGVKYVAMTSLANEYAHYVTTKEEYSMQGYEGGSNLFGPNSLEAYTEILKNLAEHLQRDEKVLSSAKPLDLTKKQVRLRPGVLFDAAPSGKVFGHVDSDVHPSYQVGDLIKVNFWGAHPNNAVGIINSYLTVEFFGDDGHFHAVKHDWDPETKMTWKRVGLAQSRIEIEWQSSQDTVPGTYRICHFGASKALLSGSILPYQGCSQGFAIRN